MKMTAFKKALSLLVCIVLIAAIALSTAGCSDNKNPSGNTETPAQTEITELGKGNTSFSFAVVDKDGKTTEFKINTNKETVGEALLELGLIAGEESTYGLYVKTVNGQTLDYNTDKRFWAFYENGKFAASGVDTTKIVTGAKYEFRADK